MRRTDACIDIIIDLIDILGDWEITLIVGTEGAQPCWVRCKKQMIAPFDPQPRAGWCTRASRHIRRLHAAHALSASTLHNLINTNHALLLLRAASTEPQMDPISSPRSLPLPKSWDRRLGSGAKLVTADGFPTLTDLDLGIQLIYTEPTDRHRLQQLEQEAARRLALPRSQRPPCVAREDLSATSALREVLAQATQVHAVRHMPNLLAILHAATLHCLGNSTPANTIAIMRSWVAFPKIPEDLAYMLWNTVLAGVPGSTVYTPPSEGNEYRLTGSNICRAIWAIGMFHKANPRVRKPTTADLRACGAFIMGDLDSVSVLDTFNLLSGLVALKDIPACMPLHTLLSRFAWLAPSIDAAVSVSTIYQLSQAVALDLVTDVSKLISINSMLLLGQAINDQLGSLSPRDVVNLLLALSRMHVSPADIGLDPTMLSGKLNAGMPHWNQRDVTQTIYALSHRPVNLDVDRSMLLQAVVRCTADMRSRDIAQTLLRLHRVVAWPPPPGSNQRSVPLRYTVVCLRSQDQCICQCVNVSLSW